MSQGTALNIKPKPSRWLALFLVALHLLACAAVFSADVAGLQYRLALLVPVMASLILALHRMKTDEMACLPDGRLQVLREKDWLQAELLPETMVWPWLIVLAYRIEGEPKRVSVVIMPDSLEPELFRRFKVWLKWGAAWAGESLINGVRLD